MPAFISLALIAITSVLASLLLIADVSASGPDKDLRSLDPSGVLETISTRGAEVTRANPFFQSLGSNGRSCATCHVPDQAWSISPSDLRRRFDETAGTDPIFRSNDSSNSPDADVSTRSARRRAYSMLLSKGLIRVGLGVPQNAEFELAHVDDPYGFASARELSLFRRPLPSTNLGFLNSIMWDGRETLHNLLPTGSAAENLAALKFDLSDQSNAATRGHAQAGRELTSTERRQIVEFETSLFTAQVEDVAAGRLNARAARGGPERLSEQQFSVGINDLRVNPATTPPTVDPPAPGMTLFSAWGEPWHTPAEAAIARGEAIFNSRSFQISGVAGLNDALALPTFRGTCTTCHNTPNAGNHSVAAPLNIGVADASRRTPDLPLYTLRNRATGELRQTTDPGRALITGKWADISKFKGPVLRGLAARAPYFHNGSAAGLDDVVDFYDVRFGITLSRREHEDLVAFLRAL
jgi:cytochrome c peroxidase